MAEGFFDKIYNPDVLSCLANLSSDEVFTPPEIANQMLDMLPQELFKSNNTTFLDPACKSGVFLREIAKRLLKNQIPGYEERIQEIDAKKRNNMQMDAADEFFKHQLQDTIDHIFYKQLFGIAITELTSLLSRRSVYCSKYPNSEFSVTKFDDAEGNIRFRRVEHGWDRSGRCVFCGASKTQFERGDELESHAYEWIHTLKTEEIFNMKFDVVISNPPYQIETSGSVESQATPIYNKFIEQAKLLKPKYLSMIVPSRWMNGGFGLDSFRGDMLSDRHIRVLHDYVNAADCFPGVAITGGVCYFLWDRDNEGKCNIVTHKDGDRTQTTSERYLLEEGLETFIRHNEAISILQKIIALKEASFAEITSQRDPFGLNYYENGKEKMFKLFLNEQKKNTNPIYSFGWQRDGISYAESKYISTNIGAVDKYKVFVSKANGGASNKIPYSVLSKPFVGAPNTICNMTYLMIGPFESQSEADNVTAYITTKFFRFLVSLMKNTQNAYKKVYTYVPMQDFSKPWTDEELYKKYGLTNDEITFIELMIKPMDLSGGDADA